MIPPAVPALVAELLGRNTPRLAWCNELGGTTFTDGTRFVKWNPRHSGIDLEAERIRMRWAIQWHLVPRVLDWGANEVAQWMVTAALPGDGAVTESWLARPLDAARAIGQGLRRLHDALPVADCPFIWSPQTRTKDRVAIEGLNVPPIDRLVVCHGDACSPNNFGRGWEAEFFRAYGIERDEKRIAYYRFLWDNEDKIGIDPVATSALVTLD